MEDTEHPFEKHALEGKPRTIQLNNNPIEKRENGTNNVLTPRKRGIKVEELNHEKIKRETEVEAGYIHETWMRLIKLYIEEGKLPRDSLKAKTVSYRTHKYVVIKGRLFKRGFSTPFL